ncbi:hypothetical protein [Enterococcus mundtii]|uniref:hypothetical protein n=1 Tax=Enterococcus mundtii TaxID=53346 RepID=UPI001A95C6DE|nr:hypothetical protein [Enterococcus mundtii]MBO1087210.1 hypothetical protein [Enterococcus mundtii]
MVNGNIDYDEKSVELNRQAMSKIHKSKVHLLNYNVFIIPKIEQLLEKYKHIAIVDKSFCCYGNKISCWVDIDGEDFGWIFLTCLNDDKEIDINKCRSKLFEIGLRIAKQESSSIMLISEGKKSGEVMFIDAASNGSVYRLVFYNDDFDTMSNLY